MEQIGVVQPWSLAVALQLILAVTLPQSFATVIPATSAPPHRDPGRPEMGRYNVTNSSGSVCLMANMGLQLNITLFSLGTNQTVQEVLNLQPNHTHSSGSCHAESASLQLIMDVDQTNLTFLFTLNSTSKKYNLSEVFLSTVLPDIAEPFLAHNENLDYLRGTLGFSYMCREKQSLQITQNLTINTFQLQVQPFGLTESQFGAAEECLLDEDDMLIPIIVGAALAALVLIVLLAYLIGRKRSHAGYQTI